MSIIARLLLITVLLWFSAPVSGSNNVERVRRIRYRRPRHSSDPQVYIPAHEPPRFEQSSAADGSIMDSLSGVSPSKADDVISSLYQLVQRGKQQSDSEAEAMKEEEADAEALRADLEKRHAEQEKKQNMLNRIQKCLAESESESESVPRSQSTQQKAADDKRAKELEMLTAKLAERENNLLAAEAKLKEKEAALDRRAKAFAANVEATNNNVVDAQDSASASDSMRFEQIRSSSEINNNFPPSSITPIANPTAPAPSTANLEAQIRSLQELVQSKIANDDKIKQDLHSAAEQEHIDSIIKEHDKEQEVFFTKRLDQFKIEARRNCSAAFQVQWKQHEAEIQAIQDRRAHARTPLEFMFNQCHDVHECGACTSNPLCAWCATSQKCLPHNVNTGSSTGHLDGMQSGQCTVDDWRSRVSGSLTVLSLNVFGADADESRRHARSNSIVQLVSASKPDVVAFQEADDWFMELLMASSLTNIYIHASNFGSAHAPGGLFILSKFPVSHVRYYEATSPGQFLTDQRGRVLIVHVDVPSQSAPVVMAVTTLDWRQQADSSFSRATSLDFMFSLLDRNVTDDVLVMGDFNFDDGAEPESSHIPDTYTDLWPTLHPSDDGFTWDPAHNALARATDPSAGPARVDRVLLRSSHWLPTSVKTVGCGAGDLLCMKKNTLRGTAAAPESFPSNHYGLLSVFTRFQPYCEAE